jgi:hypothetical protein
LKRVKASQSLAWHWWDITFYISFSFFLYFFSFLFFSFLLF